MGQTRKIGIMIAIVIAVAVVAATWIPRVNPDGVGRFMKWQIEGRQVASGDLKAGYYRVGWFPG